jgi:hypothetical protein
MSSHEAFEELCARATTGDLSSDEFSRLREHLFECAGCRAAYGDFHAIAEQGFPVLDSPNKGRLQDRLLPHAGMKRRFSARARKEGISISWRVERTRRRKVLMSAAVSFLILVLVGGTRLYRTNLDRQTEAAGQMARLSVKVAELERLLSETRRLEAPPAAPARVESKTEPEQDVAAMRALSDYETAVADRDRLEETVTALWKEMAQLRQDSLASRAEAERLELKLKEADVNLSRSREELEQLRAARSADAVTIAQLQRQLVTLTATIRDQSDTIQRDRELLAREKDIRDIIAARNLRIIDVRDDGTPGRMRPLPGRIFYTQGKSLIFYAYDLHNKGNLNNVAFQVWGKRDGRTQAPRSLGILYVDDATQNRWVLKFEDPEVLAQIDQVFVTVEPPGGSRQPTGKQLLTAAFLNEAPNHP